MEIRDNAWYDHTDGEIECMYIPRRGVLVRFEREGKGGMAFIPNAVMEEVPDDYGCVKIVPSDG